MKWIIEAVTDTLWVICWFIAGIGLAYVVGCTIHFHLSERTYHQPKTVIEAPDPNLDVTK